MLLRLGADQVNRYWSAIKETIRISSSQYDVADLDSMQNGILKNLLYGKMQCWVGVKSEKPNLVIITSIEKDLDNSIYLLIYSLYSSRLLSISNWKEALATLSSFGKLNNCTKIKAITKIPRIISIAKELNFDINTRLIEYNLE